MIRGRLVALGAGAAGFAVGAAVIAALGGGSASEGATPAGTTSAPPESTAPSSSSTTSRPPGEAPEISDEPVLLVWTSGGLASGLADATAELAGVEAVSMVRGEELRLVGVEDAAGAQVESYTDGWAVPLDVLAIEPSTHADFAEPVDRAAVRSLGEGEALLSSTSARLRGVAPGATLTLATGTVTVVGVVDDLSVAGAELTVDLPTGLALGVATDRFLLIAHRNERAPLQAAIDARVAELGDPSPVRFRGPGETTWLRHGDAVLPLAHVKERFGEFAVRDLGGRAVEIDPDWIAEHIVEAEVPILGPVRCHRAAIEPLRVALTSLVDDAISHLVSEAEFGGCFVPRRIGAGLALSRHTWGIALDLNVGDNPRGSFASQDARLVDAMRAAGFGWGGIWLVPDPAHYEAIDFGSVVG